MLRFLVLCLLFNASCGGPAVAQAVEPAKQAAPPAGFRWQPLPEVRAAMLRPAGWYYLGEHPRNAEAYFLTKEEIVGGGQFQTGMSINVVQQVEAKTEQKAAAYAQAFIANIGHGPGQQILASEEKVTGRFHTYLVRYQAPTATGESKIIWQWAMANTQTDTLYIMTFESPKKESVAAWELGNTMFSQFKPDSRF